MSDEKSHNPIRHSSTCPACGSELEGPYCTSCGRRDRLPARPLRAAGPDLLRDVALFARRFARSLATLVFRPGELSREYLAGHDGAYVGPARLFVDVGIGAFLLTRLLPSEVGLFGIGPTLFGEHPSAVEWLAACYGMGAAATAHWAVLRRRKPLFMESAVFVLHVTTFSFLLAPLGGLLSATLSFLASDLQFLGDLAPPLVLAVYWMLALRRFTDSDRQRNAKDVLLTYGTFVVLLVPMLLLELW
jgi:Protein of unknown function (DUF3667)